MNRTDFSKALLAIIAMLAMAACKQAPTPAPPNASQSKIAPNSEAKPIAADVFVPIPKDIQCSVQGMSSFVGPGDNGKMIVEIPSIEGISCGLSDTKRKKTIPITSTKVTGGLVPTRSFGDLRLTSTDTNIYSSGVEIAIHNDKLQSLRDFLKK